MADGLDAEPDPRTSCWPASALAVPEVGAPDVGVSDVGVSDVGVAGCDPGSVAAEGPAVEPPVDVGPAADVPESEPGVWPGSDGPVDAPAVGSPCVMPVVAGFHEAGRARCRWRAVDPDDPDDPADGGEPAVEEVDPGVDPGADPPVSG